MRQRYVHHKMIFGFQDDATKHVVENILGEVSTMA